MRPSISFTAVWSAVEKVSTQMGESLYNSYQNPLPFVDNPDIADVEPSTSDNLVREVKSVKGMCE